MIFNSWRYGIKLLLEHSLGYLGRVERVAVDVGSRARSPRLAMLVEWVVHGKYAAIKLLLVFLIVFNIP